MLSNYVLDLRCEAEVTESPILFCIPWAIPLNSNTLQKWTLEKEYGAELKSKIFSQSLTKERPRKTARNQPRGVTCFAQV